MTQLTYLSRRRGRYYFRCRRSCSELHRLLAVGKIAG